MHFGLDYKCPTFGQKTDCEMCLNLHQQREGHYKPEVSQE